MPGTEWSPRAAPSSTGAEPSHRACAEKTWMRAASLSTTAKGRPWLSPVPSIQRTSWRTKGLVPAAGWPSASGVAGRFADAAWPAGAITEAIHAPAPHSKVRRFSGRGFRGGQERGIAPAIVSSWCAPMAAIAVKSFHLCGVCAQNAPWPRVIRRVVRRVKIFSLQLFSLQMKK